MVSFSLMAILGWIFRFGMFGLDFTTKADSNIVGKYVENTALYYVRMFNTMSSSTMTQHALYGKHNTCVILLYRRCVVIM